MRFLSIGECMGELSATGAPGGYTLRFAGDTYNTAWYLRRCAPAAAVAYCTAIGTDAISDRMLAGFESAGIDTGFVIRDAARTIGLYLIDLHEGERSFTYWRSAAAARFLTEDGALLERALDWADTVYLSGITVAVQAGEGRERLVSALVQARQRGKRIVFDTNMRPRLWESAARMTATITQVAGLADIVLPSFDEEAAAFGDSSPAATAARYAAAGAATVVVKNGGGPLWVLAPGIDEALAVPSAERVVDTTAAGDSFNAGLLQALDAGRDLRSSALAGAALARRVIGAQGALVDV